MLFDMNKKQILKKQMYGRVLAFFSQHESTFTAYIPLHQEITSITQHLVTLDAAEGTQATITTDAAARKQRMHQQWASSLVRLNATARAYARRHQPDLLQAIFVDESHYLRIAGEEAAERGKASVSILRVHVEDMAAKGYDIDDARIDAIFQDILAFESILATPAIGIDQKQNGTRTIATIIKTIDESLEVADDLIRSKYATSHPNLIRAYFIARQIGKTPTNHTTLKAKVLENSLPLWKAEVIIRELNRRNMTNLDGLATIEAFRPGQYTIDVYKDTTLLGSQVVKIPLGKTVSLTFDLKS